MAASKSDFLQIRVTPGQKATLRRRARAAGMDLSAFVLARALPASQLRFAEIVAQLEREEGSPAFALAALNDFLTGLTAPELLEATAGADVRRLSSFLMNYVAAMVEQSAQMRGVSPPAWTSQIRPLEAPWFAATLPGLRQHLLQVSPVAYRRRNLFVDATVGDRV